MKLCVLALSLTVACASNKEAGQGQLTLAARFQEQSKVNPMRKIIGMLQDLAKELEREGEAEAEVFEKAMCICEGGAKDLQKVAEDSSAAIEILTAKTTAETAEKARMKQEIADHTETAATTKTDLEKAIALREKDYKEFGKKDKDMTLNTENLGKAIVSISQGMGASSLMQMEGAPRLRRLVEITKYLSSDDRGNVLAFLDQGTEEGENVKAPQSGEILGILKSMKDEMEKDHASMKKDEEVDLTNFNELKAAKEQEIALNEKAIIVKDKRSGALALSLSEDTHALEDAKDELANAQNFLSTMDEQCARKKKERDTRAKMRADEIAAVSDAIKILNDDDALDVFKKSLPSAAMLQQKKQTYDALVQVSEEGVRLSKKQSKLVLAAVGQHNAIHQHAPGGVQEFAGAAENMVKGMIDGMVGVLHDEDVDDEHKKDWCANETEIGHNIETEKKNLIEQCDSEIAELTDTLATLGEEIKTLTAQIAATDKLVHEATEQRKKEHQEFVDGFATMATAIRLLDKAMTRLHKFYNPQKFAAEKKAVQDAALAKAGLGLNQKSAREPAVHTAAVARLEAAADFDALVQTASARRNGARVAPVELPDTPTTYEKKESGGVIGLMNDFKTDLKSDMTEAETEEKFAAKDYVRVMTEAQESRAQDTKSLLTKKTTKAQLDEKLVSTKDLKIKTDKELHNIQLYLVQLHAECDFLLRNFEVRHEGRVEEEAGLESAETIVTDLEPPSHTEIEKKYKEEHSAKDVQEHWPHKFGSETRAEHMEESPAESDIADQYGEGEISTNIGF